MLGAEWALPHTGFSIFHLGLGCFLNLLLGLDIRKADWKGLHMCHTCKWQNCPGPELVVFFRTVIWTPDPTGWTGTAPALTVAIDHTPGLMHMFSSAVPSSLAGLSVEACLPDILPLCLDPV